MDVIRARTAGFCMGVGLALQKLEAALQERAADTARICTLGPIIHNPQVLEDYARKGVARLEEPEEARPGDMVVIRAHGVTRQTEERLRAGGARVLDATCPKVKKAQLSIARATAGGAALLLFGEADHPEVRGLVSYAGGPAYVFGDMEALEALSLPEDRPYVLASQTTQDRALFAVIERLLRGRLPGLTVLATICDATRERQDEARSIAARADVMVVVGGRESGNTRRLADVARAAGIATYHVETVDELRPEFFAQKARAGLTAGASTPKSLIEAAEERLTSL
ncbi:4-hydroxy-3-methylbut-2-enyl diphosphate reductase [Desulfovibrio legallii]|jgi:4-hydroxy-3-methylbut-2-enyl diphosphate reductase|uniref:4-hydroxy-3-methylbut-2-enyl diphosphate reductase n=1 Tax=Desulfovibrio legallii TaxID=571438 RepID=A0A1G7PC54_9BACT|nr:4-hydroxy-3-methylbut-2-enyl diphosphate reductase [Desulfovibrio legallii]SDF83886.1 4-hydroxy-3-methylbut-2-enyl diphosphate reductase [Desulfovibrio legallii]